MKASKCAWTIPRYPPSDLSEVTTMISGRLPWKWR